MAIYKDKRIKVLRKLVLLVLIFVALWYGFSRITYKGFAYTEIGNGEVRIDEYSGTKKDTLVIPEEINGKKVTVIGKGGFYNSSIKNIILPDSIKSINAEAFSETQIKKIKLPRSLEHLDKMAFSSSKIEHVFIPKEARGIKSGAFSEMYDLKTIEVEKGNKYLKFENNTLFTNKGKTINIFLNFDKRKEYIIPKEVEVIEEEAFYGQGLSKIIFEEGSKAYSIKDAAFAGNENLKSLVLPESTKYIGYFTLEGTSVKEIYFPKNIIKIDKEFMGDLYGLGTSLSKITVDKDNKNYTSHQGVLYDKNMTELILYPSCKPEKSYAIPAGVKKASLENFDMGAELKNVKFPASVKQVGPVPDCEGVYGVDFIIYCKENSYTHKYAKNNGLEYKLY